MEKLRCKCVKGIDGFTWGEVYDVEFAGRVWWALNDDGKIVSGASESFDPIEESVSEDLLAEKKYAMEEYPWQHGYESWDSPIKDFKAGANRNNIIGIFILGLCMFFILLLRIL